MDRSTRRKGKSGNESKVTDVGTVQPQFCKTYAYRIDMDNHLGTLYRLIPKVIPYNISDKICIITDFIDDELARNVRNFISLIPFDINIVRLNDTDNQPKSEVFNYLKSRNGTSIIEKYKNYTYKNYFDDKCDNSSFDIYMKRYAEQWIWENYKNGIWRAVPLTLKAYINSPIYDIINIILWKVYLSIVETFHEELYVGTVVLQRTPFNMGIGRHIDNCGYRRISFIYYLTPDDWSDADGGNLIFDNHKITPKFNQLILWKLVTPLTPDSDPIYHEVSCVKADNNRPRLALVGFFDQPTQLSITN
jgi:hypothetical protein